MLDPDAKALLDFIASKNLPSYHTLPVAEARAYYRDRRQFSQPDAPEVGAVDDLPIDGPGGRLMLRRYRPLGSAPDAALPLLVYYHGGGHTIGDLETHDTLCRQLCNQSGWSVLAVDYRLGPEHRFPAAVEDSWAALQWAQANAATLGIDPDRIAVGGDSAGGNLAAVMALMARDAGAPKLVFQLLVYPATDLHYATPSHAANGQGYLLTRDVIDYFTRAYVGPEADLDDWRLSPALASDFHNLPPALVLTAGYDPLHDEGRDYADKLHTAGNRVEYVDYPGQIHGFLPMGRVIRQANEAVAVCARALREAGGA
ncbi:acetyl esterase [Noviherbaspirillum humi]|uniref:Acetyl esterase n=1 Tax=Noviherbaspirillum humi TaxID=1688639 RepID=A0A239IQQ4_9BURK|nr:alpha/beta hydrolase [Noviherbaspirillum humi]SNS95393.1 acetyl esterase [Noviherbaspirillum humi]